MASFDSGDGADGGDDPPHDQELMPGQRLTGPRLLDDSAEHIRNEDEADAIQRALAEFGLNGSQARVLLALIHFGGGAASQLAAFAGVPRTSVYPLLNELSSLGLAEPPRGQVKYWTAPAREQLVERLWAVEENQFRAMRARKERARKVIVDLLPEPPAVATPHVQFARTVAEHVGLYARCLAAAKREVLVFNRGPYVSSGPNPAVWELIERGVTVRALYDDSHFELGNEGAKQECARYAAAGVDSRVVANLPLRLAVFDRQTVLMPLEDPESPTLETATFLHVRHRAFGALIAAAFEHYWSEGRPFPSVSGGVRPQEPAADPELRIRPNRSGSRATGRRRRTKPDG